MYTVQYTLFWRLINFYSLVIMSYLLKMNRYLTEIMSDYYIPINVHAAFHVSFMAEYIE